MGAHILMPALSPTMEEGTLARWFVKVGDKVSPGDVIAEIETDKATMEVEAVDEGVVTRLLVPEGAEHVKVQTPIAELDGAITAGANAPSERGARTEPAAAATGVTQKGPAPAALRTGGPGAPSRDHDVERVLASPLARRLAAQRGVDLRALKGSGPHGRIVKADVDAASSAPSAGTVAPHQQIAAAPAPVRPSAPQRPANLPYKPDEYVLTPLDAMRKTIARRMTQSFQDVPHFPLVIDVEMERLLEARKQLNARLKDDGVKLSINDILIRASALALKKVPDSNVSYVEGALLRHKHAHVAVAVAIDGGLITPVLFHADQKGLAEISREMTALAEKARARKLLPHEYEGGTFTISNLGMYGIKSFSSIINEPQAMILSVGAGEQRPIVKAGAIAIATMVTLTLTCDHRAVDGVIGAEFLAALRTFVEDPMTMML